MLILGALQASCSTRPATQVMVFVDADPGVRAATVSLEVRVEGATGSGASVFADRELTTVSAPRWPVRIALVPLDGDGERVYRVTVTALDGATPTRLLVAQVRAISGYRPSETVRIDLLLEDACLRHVPCAEDQTCVAGACVAAMIDPATLLPLHADAGNVDAAAARDTGLDTSVPIDGATDSPAPMDMGTDTGLETDAGLESGVVDGGDGGVRAPTEEAALLASSGASNDYFGYSVALSEDGSRALVGAYGDSTGAGFMVGSAWVFLRAGTSWIEEATLLASDGEAGDAFGCSLALSADGSRALVGAYADDATSGSARVFRRTGSSWTEEATLLGAGIGGGGGQYFGFSVALAADGSRALVGAFGDSPAGEFQAGTARVFLRTGTSWAEEAALVAFDAASGDYLGASVSLSADGSRALVGAYYDDTAAAISGGSARVFARIGTTWAEEATLLAAAGATNDYFGKSVALSADGSRALVGAPYDSNARGANAGSVRVFLRTGTSWAAESTLLAAAGARTGSFGRSLAVSADGSRALVGAGVGVGVFARTGTSWTADASLLAAGGGPGGDYDEPSVALSGDGRRALVGLWRDDNAGGTAAGGASVFVLDGP